MKKTLSLLCAACIAVGMQAQTYMVNDFESGLNGANAAWGGTAELIDKERHWPIIQVFVYNLLCWKGRKISHGLVMN